MQGNKKDPSRGYDVEEDIVISEEYRCEFWVVQGRILEEV